MVRSLRRRFQLRPLGLPAKGTQVRRSFIFFWMIIAVLFSSMDVPVLAHAYEAGATHLSEMGHLEAQPDADDRDNEDRSATPDHVVHHHCSGDALARLPDLKTSVTEDRPELFALVAMPMASRATAPPTEPPAA